jgi:type II secretory ATPase GspE/PulE/Tfp pilus assembly ATPase PilB-like protein
LLPLPPELKALIARRAPQNDIRAAAGDAGWRSLEGQAADAVAAGRTTVEEVERVVA